MKLLDSLAYISEADRAITVSNSLVDHPVWEVVSKIAEPLFTLAQRLLGFLGSCDVTRDGEELLNLTICSEDRCDGNVPPAGRALRGWRRALEAACPACQSGFDGLPCLVCSGPDQKLRQSQP